MAKRSRIKQLYSRLLWNPLAQQAPKSVQLQKIFSCSCIEIIILTRYSNRIFSLLLWLPYALKVNKDYNKIFRRNEHCKLLLKHITVVP